MFINVTFRSHTRVVGVKRRNVEPLSSGDRVLPISTDKFSGVIVCLMGMTNHQRTWGRKPRLVGENRDSSSRREDHMPDEGSG
ncbi:hypothetical protein TNCV_4090741 [Trichonephila clavipes]|uniref:Uncharacterized protein n=1 Tax=Trichonephila clavipes TaxID=2585209 RepID=A0A8X6SCW5_TRICX|nr:hypothetical protein TNCV_4090741 [Trichonephila clavipes]